MTEYIPELARWPLWQVVKSFDLAYHRVVPMLEAFGITIHRTETGQEYISKPEFRQKVLKTD